VILKDRFGVPPIWTLLAEHGLPISPSTVRVRANSPVSPA
jgi:hypothetical protein